MRILVTIDGYDCLGKTTLAKEVVEKFNSEPQQCRTKAIYTSEPYFGKCNSSDLSEKLEFYKEDRERHVNEVIIPALDKGNVVICDRFDISTLLYQGVVTKYFKRHHNVDLLPFIIVNDEMSLINDLTAQLHPFNLQDIRRILLLSRIICSFTKNTPYPFPLKKYFKKNKIEINGDEFKDRYAISFEDFHSLLNNFLHKYCDSYPTLLDKNGKSKVRFANRIISKINYLFRYCNH